MSRRFNLILLIAISFFSSFFSITSGAQGIGEAKIQSGQFSYQITDRSLTPYFSNVMIFGSSISSDLAYLRSIGHYAYGFSQGPASLIAKHYQSKVTNVSEGWGIYLDLKVTTLGSGQETGLDKITRFLNPRDGYSPHSTSDSRNGLKLRQIFSRASAIISIDAFYMAVAFNQCREFRPGDIERKVRDFVQAAKEDNKILVLGNVAKEDWKKVSWIARQIIEHNNESCRQEINAVLSRQCTVERNCYLIDMEEIVANLNTTGKLVFGNGLQVVGHRNMLIEGTQIRPDGINIGPAAGYFLAEKILTAIRDNPPMTTPSPLRQP